MAENNNVVESLEIDVGIKGADDFQKTIDALEVRVNRYSDALDEAYDDIDHLEVAHGKLNDTLLKTEDKLAKVTKKVGDFFNILGKASGIAKLIDEVAQANDQLGFLEKQLGSNAQTIKAWQGAVQAGGGSAQGLSNSFKTLTQGMQAFVTYGDTSMLNTMSALGVSMVDAQGHARKTDEVMLDLADTMSHMDSTQAYMLGGKLGLDDGTIGTLIQGRDALKESIAYQKTLYQSSEQDIKNSRELQKNRALLNSQWESFKTMLANQFIPIAIKVSEVVLSIFETMQKHQGTIKAVFGGLAVILSASIIPLFTRALTPLLGFIAPFAPFIAVVAALSAAFIALYDDYKTWADGGKSLFDWGELKRFMNENEFSAKNLGLAFKELGNQFKEQFIPTLKEYGEIARDLLNGDFDKASGRAQKMLGQFSENGVNVIAKATGEKAEDIGGFIGESAYRLTHYGKTYDEYNNVQSQPTGKPTKGFTAEKGKSIERVAKNIGVNPNDLAAAISFETGGTFDPSIRNKGSSATGLIQFMSGTGGTKGKYYGMTRDQFGGLSFDQQMNYVEKYFKERDKRFRAGNESNNNAGDVYGAITGYGYKRGTQAYEQNRVWDSNGNGVVEKGEMVQNPAFKAHQRNYFGANMVRNAIQPSIPQSTINNNTNTQTGGNTSNEVNIQSITVNSSSDKVSGTIQDAVFGAQQALNPLITSTH